MPPEQPTESGAIGTTSDFSDRSRLWLAELFYRLPDGSLLEGIGFQSDREVPAEWWRFALADDPQIQAALQELSLVRRSAQRPIASD